MSLHKSRLSLTEVQFFDNQFALLFDAVKHKSINHANTNLCGAPSYIKEALGIKLWR